MKRIPSLDGLRAISIAAVISSHLLWHGDTGAAAYVRTALGRMGVQVFFVVSGFLITQLLIAEERAAGRISLAGFFKRRALRIVPPYAVYVGTVVLVARMVGVPIPGRDVLHAATFTMNFQSNASWALAHGWSLSTEEQFYLAWPALAVLFGWRRMRWLAIVVMVVPLACLLASNRLPSTHWFPNGADGVAAGCLLALAWDRESVPRLARSAIPAIAVVLLVARVAFAPYHASEFLEALSGIAIAIIVARVIVESRGAIGTVLNAGWVVWLGQLSYSLYLWQQLFSRPTLEHEPLPIPLAVACAFACALLSYHVVERPLMQARARLRSGAYRDRTDDLLVANQALSQLS